MDEADNVALRHRQRAARLNAQQELELARTCIRQKQQKCVFFNGWKEDEERREEEVRPEEEEEKRKKVEKSSGQKASAETADDEIEALTPLTFSAADVEREEEEEEDDVQGKRRG